MITAYLYNSCSSCRKAEGLLQEEGVDFEKREFFKQKMTRDELIGLMERTGLSVADLLSTRSTPYRELDIANRKLDDDEIIDLMVIEPRLLKRPILVSGNQAVVGYNAEAIRQLLTPGGAK